ncbi:MAG TPA: ATP-binding protein [Solirubrobacterales bacterium]|nr:ATP-binding protein [Solirubrobacterales bacterium]
MSEPELHLVLPARAENLIVVRQAIAGLGEALGMPGQRVDDLKTVVTEACNNVVVHAYDGIPGPLEVTASSDDDEVEVTVSDEGMGFQPRATESGSTLGLGLPLIASLSNSFEVTGRPGVGTSTKVRFALPRADLEGASEAGPGEPIDELTVAISPGAIVRPVLARVIGALAARAELSVERLSDTVLIGDAVSAHPGDDFATGRIEIAIDEADGALRVRVGPLVTGGGERLLAQMRIPGDEGSLQALARSMEVVQGASEDGRAAEYLEFEVAG